jgi:hypothetical protein
MYLTCEIADDVMLWSDEKMQKLMPPEKNTIGGNEKAKKHKKGKTEKKNLEAKIDVEKIGKKGSKT